MGTTYNALKDERLNLALERLELLLEPDSREVLDGLDYRTSAHLPELSDRLAKSPFLIKKRLDRLKAAGFVFSSKRYPKGYALNKLKCLKVKLQAAVVIKSL